MAIAVMHNFVLREPALSVVQRWIAQLVKCVRAISVSNVAVISTVQRGKLASITLVS